MKFVFPWNKPRDNYWYLLLFVLGAESAGLLGSLFTFSAIPTWYATLTKPAFSPPNYLFGPVWTTLYALMGISAYLVWRKYQFRNRSIAFWRVFGIQLILNSLWSILFFGFKWIGVALVEIIFMWFYIIQSLRESYRLVPAASYLLYPYLGWVTFASLLNFALYMLN